MPNWLRRLDTDRPHDARERVVAAIRLLDQRYEERRRLQLDQLQNSRLLCLIEVCERTADSC